jgi:hypothetical protein
MILMIFVNKKMQLNKGHYSILVPSGVPEELAQQANIDPKTFRDFVVRYAKVEVL